MIKKESDFINLDDQELRGLIWILRKAFKEDELDNYEIGILDRLELIKKIKKFWLWCFIGKYYYIPAPNRYEFEKACGVYE